MLHQNSQRINQPNFSNFQSSESRSAYRGIGTILPQNDRIDQPDRTACKDFYPFLDEFRKSAIPDRLTLANVKYCEPGDTLLLEILTETKICKAQKSQNYTGTAARRILDDYQNATLGGWVVYGTTLNGDRGEVAYVKLDHPRIPKAQGFGKHPSKVKPLKYDMPAGLPAVPILPWVTKETALQIYSKFKVTPLEGETFWQAVKRSGIPIVICEGFKKAASVLAHGYPAICSRSIYTWGVKGSKGLDGIKDVHPIIGDFATPGRKVYICFDQDIKPRTIQNVSIQIKQLGQALDKLGCDSRVTAWDSSLGKGVDDVLYGQRENAQVWLDDVLKGAQSVKDWLRNDRAAWVMESIRRAKRLPLTPDRETSGGYFPETPAIEPGEIRILEAPTSAGKTFEIARQGKQWKQDSGFVLMLYNINALGKQAAARCDLPHVSDYWMDSDPQKSDRAGRKEWEADIAHRQGAVMCFDSLHHLPNWVFKEKLLVVLDECNQGLSHLTGGETLGDRQETISNLFDDAIVSAAENGAILMSEAVVYPHSLELVKRLSGLKTVRYFNHDRPVDRGYCEIEKTLNPGALVYQAVGSVKSGEKILYMTSSQKHGRRLDKILSGLGYNVLRIDGQTNRGGAGTLGAPSPFEKFFDNPDEFLTGAACDVLICSPSVRTGLSIEGNHFDRRFGYFPDCSPDEALQHLTRYRPNVPSHIAAPDFVLTTGVETIAGAQGIKARLEYNTEISNKFLSLDNVAISDDRQALIVSSFIDFYAAAAALSGAQKSISHRCLVQTLENESFTVVEVKPGRSKEGERLLREARESIWREDALTLALSTPDEDFKTGVACTLEDEWRGIKSDLIEKYPGIDWNDEAVCYHSYTRQDGLMRRGVDMQVLVEDLEAAKLLDMPETQAARLSGLNYRRPTRALKALLINAIGVLRLLEPGLILENTNQVCVEVAAAARSLRKDLRYYGMNISDQGFDSKGRATHTPIDICQKLLKKFGLEFNVVSRPRSNGIRDRQYEVCPIVPRHYGDMNNSGHNREIEAQDRFESLKYRKALLDAARERLARLKELNKSSRNQAEIYEPETVETVPPDYPENLEPPENLDDDEGEVYYFEDNPGEG